MCLEEWASQADPEGTWNLTNVPYDGDPEEIVALMSGELPFATLQVHGAKSAVEAGQRPLHHDLRRHHPPVDDRRAATLAPTPWSWAMSAG